jgi:hypothetical protein
MQWQRHLVLLAEAARDTFVALRYQILDTGGNLIPSPCYDGGQSWHEVFVAYARIEIALQAVRRPDIK